MLHIYDLFIRHNNLSNFNLAVTISRMWTMWKLSTGGNYLIARMQFRKKVNLYCGIMKQSLAFSCWHFIKKFVAISSFFSFCCFEMKFESKLRTMKRKFQLILITFCCSSGRIKLFSCSLFYFSLHCPVSWSSILLQFHVKLEMSSLLLCNYYYVAVATRNRPDSISGIAESFIHEIIIFIPELIFFIDFSSRS